MYMYTELNWKSILCATITHTGEKRVAPLFIFGLFFIINMIIMGKKGWEI
jgi:hypothetical protein